MKPLWKRVINNVEEQFGELIGRCYVNKYFSESAKHKALTMVNYLKNELRNKIMNLDWMEDITKDKALNKMLLSILKLIFAFLSRAFKAKATWFTAAENSMP